MKRDGFDYDLFVIGGGSGGVRAARFAASLGKRVAIAEADRFGGTCVIRGCVPKKLLVYASHFHESFEDAAGFGWQIDSARFSWSALIAAKDREIARLESLYQQGLETNGATIFKDRAVFAGPHELRLISNAKTVTAERILIATGGSPKRMPDLPGHELCITSNEAFHLKNLPASIFIHGGGYIAVEFAGIFVGLGSQVTIACRADHLLRGFDRDLGDMLASAMRAKGVRVMTGQQIAAIREAGAGTRRVALASGEVVKTETVMLAVGRAPNTANLGLEHAGVELGYSGEIKVDAWSRSNVEHILAVGDVTDRLALTPVAIHEAMCLVETEFKGNPVSPDHDLVATAVFAQPEVGTVGLSEERAAEKHPSIDVFKTVFRPMKHTLSGRDEMMLMKIIAETASGLVLGVHIVGEGAAEMVQVLAIALKMGARKADFDRTMAVHPTAAEELVTLNKPSYRVVNGKRAT